MFSEVRTSELGGADGGFALLYAVRSRICAVERQWNYIVKRPSVEVKRDWEDRATICLEEMRDLEVRLDNTSLNDNKVIRDCREVLKGRGSVSDELEWIFGKMLNGGRRSVEEPWIRNVLKELKAQCDRARVQELCWRLKEEIICRSADGWFVVFDTLTVEPSEYEKVFKTGSVCWREYIRRIERTVGIGIYGNVRKAHRERKNDPYHSYFGITERGSRTGRLHIHAVHLIRELPSAWRVDPNVGLAIPEERKIAAMVSLWPHGFSCPIGCRFSDHDAFGRIGWRWPVKFDSYKKGCTAVVAKPPAAMAAYMVKYLVKSYGEKKGEDRWRSRLSRGLGLMRMRKAIRMCKTKTLIKALDLPTPWLKVEGKSIPNNCLRVEILRNLIFRLRNSTKLTSPSGSKKSMILRLLLRVPVRQCIVEQLRSLKKTTQASNLQNTTSLLIKTLSETDVSEMQKVFDDVFSSRSERYQSRGTCHVRSY